MYEIRSYNGLSFSLTEHHIDTAQSIDGKIPRLSIPNRIGFVCIRH